MAEAEYASAAGRWSGLGGVAAAIGPFVGGWLIGLSWRWIFLLNVPLSLVVVLVTVRHVPESRDPLAAPRLDPLGAALTVVGLGGVTYALIERTTVAAFVGVVALVAFVAVERRGRNAMLPLDIFRSRTFTGANVMTFLLYGALGAAFFLLVIALERALYYPPT